MKKLIKEKIEDYEFYSNFFHKFSGRYVKATNILIQKRTDRVVADVLLGFEDHQEKYFDCEYKLSDLLK